VIRSFGALNVHAIVTLASSILILGLWTLSTKLSHALAFVILFGAVSGAVIGLPPASVAYILGPDPRKQAKLGQWTGLMYTCAAPFALTGPVIAGHLITQYGGNYLTVQLWSGTSLFLSAVFMALAIWSRMEDDKTDVREKRVNSQGQLAQPDWPSHDASEYASSGSPRDMSIRSLA
jgi:MFS transporter, MCT family, solute carrier family 16 (monocarboxylic acid transporters), member 10